MAVTKIHPIKITVGRAIKYVTNPDKTGEYLLTDFINCNQGTAEYSFRKELEIANKPGKGRYNKDGKESNQAFHLIQSFKPGEVTPEEAHRIGQELVSELLGGKYTAVIGTHEDKEHIHNHIVFCAVDNVEHKRYNDCKATYRNIRKLSDRLCVEHGLDVIPDHVVSGEPVTKYTYCPEWKDGKPVEIVTTDLGEARKNCRYKYKPDIGFTEEIIPKKTHTYVEREERDWAYFHTEKYENTATSYKEWQEKKKGTSWKQTLKNDINATIKTSKTYDDFISQMLAKGYQIKGAALDGSEGKYISYLCPGQSENGRWIRGKKTSGNRGLGEDFSREKIKERIEQRAKQRAERIKILATGTKQTNLIDTSADKFKESPGLNNWAKRENLKRMSAVYAEMQRMGLHSSADVAAKIATIEQGISDKKNEMKELSQDMETMGKIVKYVNQYKQNKRYADAYKKSADPERYMQNRLSEITLYQEAERILKKSGIDPEHINLEKLKEDYYASDRKKTELGNQISKEQAEIKKLNKYMTDFQSYMTQDQSQIPQTRQANRSPAPPKRNGETL